MNWICLDLGEKRIGIAKGDSDIGIAFPYMFIKSESKKKDIDTIVDLSLENKTDAILVGLPINTNGTLGPKYHECLSFVKALEKKLRYSKKLDKEIIVETIDERYTTKIANDSLIMQDVSRKKRKNSVDAVAATIMLQNYFDSNGGNSGK